MQFILKKDEISRLKVFNSYLKLCNSVAALKTDNLFVVDNGKLTIYGDGDKGHISISLDVESSDIFMFTFNFGHFLTYLENVNSELTTVSLLKSKLYFSGNDTVANYNRVVLNTLEASAQEDIKAIPEFETSRAYTDATIIKLTDECKEAITSMSNATSILGTNNFIKITDHGVVSVDRVSIITRYVPISTGGKDFYLLKSISPLLKDASEMRIYNMPETFGSSVNTFIYINVDSLGIKMWFTSPSVDFQIPTEEEINAMSPSENEESVVTINSQEFYNIISKFDGVFDNDSWKYKQLKVNFDVTDKSKIELYYDTIVAEAHNILPVVSVEKDHLADGMFLMPTIHMKLLKEDLLREETFQFKFDFNNDEHIIIHVMNSFIDIALTKVEQ